MKAKPFYTTHQPSVLVDRSPVDSVLNLDMNSFKDGTMHSEASSKSRREVRRMIAQFYSWHMRRCGGPEGDVKIWARPVTSICGCGERTWAEICVGDGLWSRQRGGGGNEIKTGAAEYSVILILVLYLTLVLRCSRYVFPSRTNERSVLQLESETVAEPQIIIQLDLNVVTVT